MNNLLPSYIFGEVLFDYFADEAPQLGGAPFNVAWHLQAFAAAPRFISAVGDDAAGREIRQQMQQWGMDSQYLQTDPSHATGMVRVTMQQGEPSYEIVLNAAFDHIDKQALPQISGEHWLYHGSLASRCPASREALALLTGLSGQKRFIDVNLRQHWWQPERLLPQLQGACLVKMNQQELQLLTDGQSVRSPEQLLEQARNFKLANNITHLLLTMGAEGAVLLDETAAVITPELPPQPCAVVDTVGAGDAFSAVVLLGLLQQWDWRTTLARAQHFAGFIVAQRGAICRNIAIYNDFKSLWGIV